MGSGAPNHTATPKTFFAGASRASRATLDRQIALVGDHPLTEALLLALRGVVLVLNHERQIVALNHQVLVDLGFTDPTRMLGLRAGEALGCVHASTAAGGCGTTRACADCGAVLATLASTVNGEAVERECLMTRSIDGEEQPHEFRARATPVRLGEQRFTLLSLQDISAEKRCQQLDKVLLHDLLNLLGGLQGSCEHLSEVIAGAEATEALGELQQVTDRLVGTAKTHRLLGAAEAGMLAPMAEQTTVSELLTELDGGFSHHPLVEERTLRVEPPLDADEALATDRDLLLRVLTNMVKNALEATPAGGTVKVWWRRDDFPPRGSLLVWNPGEVEPRVARRIFSRYFTTKGGVGRGLGTYSMRLIGERVLGGEVRFSSSASGTTFRITLPLHTTAS